MADQRLFQGLDDEQAFRLKLALSDLAESGVLSRYVSIRIEGVLQDSPDLSDEDLLQAIRRVRADTDGITALHHYGLKLAQELKGTKNEDS